jgi:hypothetical protein
MTCVRVPSKNIIIQPTRKILERFDIRNSNGGADNDPSRCHSFLRSYVYRLNNTLRMLQRFLLITGSLLFGLGTTLLSHAFITTTPLKKQLNSQPTTRAIITTTTSTSLDLFGGLFGKEDSDVTTTTTTNKNNQSKKTTKTEKKVENEEEPKKKKPFIFLYGKPQYDWVKAKPMDTVKPMGQYNWVTGKPNPDPKK